MFIIYPVWEKLFGDRKGGIVKENWGKIVGDRNPILN